MSRGRERGDGVEEGVMEGGGGFAHVIHLGKKKAIITRVRRLRNGL